MADPTVVTCTADTWVVVATAVKSGEIHRMDEVPSKYLQTYRDTGEAAPTDNTDGVELFRDSASVSISNTVDIDVYVKAKGRDGKVRVDL